MTWYIVYNMTFMTFHSVGNVIIPTDFNLVGGLEHFFIFHNIWDNPSQTTNKIYIVYNVVETVS